MPVTTTKDIRGLVESTYFRTAADLTTGKSIWGIFLHGFNESLDINGQDTHFRCMNDDAELIAIGDIINIESNNYTTRSKQQGDRTTVIILETT